MINILKNVTINSDYCEAEKRWTKMKIHTFCAHKIQS